jgi:tRNA(Arg) A34 adenosine deaminase TadA
MDMLDIKRQMKTAIAAAHHARGLGGTAIGAALVDTDGAVVAVGGSMVSVLHDPTAHAEINAIRIAADNGKTDDLYGLTLYSTLEPCHMCLSAAAWARISRIYFGAYRKDVSASLFDITGDYSAESEAKRMNLRETTPMHVTGGICESECAALLLGYYDAPQHTRSNV